VFSAWFIWQPRSHVIEQAESLLDDGGVMQACGVCMRILQQSETRVCLFSSMSDL
jgi:hypothetical protein